MSERQPRRAGSDRERVIRASEIGRYAYCAHAWWLGSILGLPSDHRREMAEGEREHVRHGRRVRTSLGLRRLARIVLLLAAMVGIVWLAGRVVG